jgi:oligoribonuclease NrnB/cAMP/cGMP phosphodiesterase (DHH superfamily)
MIKIIYHDNCYDGFTAAWVALKALKNASFLPASYGDPVPELNEDDTVYIVDFSYPREVLESINKKVRKLVVIDHHKTAQANCEGLDYCIFDMNRSGAGLVWDYFFEDKKRPALVNYIEDRDLWRFKLPESRSIHAFISSFPREFNEWDATEAALESNFNRCAEIGQAIERFANQKIREATANGTQWKEIGGFKIPCVNVPYHMGSDVGHQLLQNYPEAPFSGYYFFNANGDEQWGLRGRDSDDFDVSTIAKQYGGGGHKKASGFLMNRRTNG